MLVSYVKFFITHHLSILFVEALTIATIADRISSGSSAHASITVVKSVGLSLSLLSSLSELVTFAVLSLSVVGTLEGLFGAETPSGLLAVNPLFLVDLDVS